VRNALDPAMVDELRTALDLVRSDVSIRAVLMTASGPHFCAGANLRWMQSLTRMSPKDAAEASRPLQDLLDRLRSLPVPLLAHVQGCVTAGGLGMVAAADFVVAEADAVFSISEARLGLVPALIAPFVAQKIGTSLFASMAVTGIGESAARMLDAGLVQRVAESADDAKQWLDNALQGVRQGSPDALRMTKAMLREMPQWGDGALGRSLDWVRRSRAEPCAAEGVAAFLAKRPPAWSESQQS
jgi:methylglutaconyl-CoA hydratase